MSALLAVDAGLHAGLALVSRQGRLVWCRSHNFGSIARLKKAAWRILLELPGLEFLVVEGGGQTAAIWEHLAARRGLPHLRVQAQDWRPDLLLPREMASAEKAKAAACRLVCSVLRAEGWSAPTMPGHDAAEAALLGVWFAARAGWRDIPIGA